MKIFSVFDDKAEAFLNPMFFPTTAYAIRVFATTANQADHDFHKYAADYTLFELGTWSEHSGEITMHPQHINLGNALSHRENDNAEA